MTVPTAAFPTELLELETFERRYYTRLCAPFPYEPTRDRLRVIHVGERGEGLQALVQFAAGDIVFRFTGEIVQSQTLYSLQIEPGRHLNDPLVMGKVLHSCEPNMCCDMATLTFFAKRTIRAGELLTMDYESTEERLFRAFDCQCGSSTCRGVIRGRTANGS